jgi:hypothetical protein
LPVAHKLWSTPNIYDFFDHSQAVKSDYAEKPLFLPEKEIPM